MSLSNSLRSSLSGSMRFNACAPFRSQCSIRSPKSWQPHPTPPSRNAKRSSGKRRVTPPRKSPFATAAGHAVAKGLFLGGVTRRFPELRFAFLEGGVGWGCQLFGDLIEHWERKGAQALVRMDPDKLDRKLLLKLIEEHGYDDIAAVLKSRDGWPDPDAKKLTGHRTELDDFAACKITRKEDWVDLYAKPYYFGCEADDRMNATAFGKANPFGAKLNAIFSSDIGHFDVIDFRDPLPEAHELVDKGLITDDDFRDFVFANSVRLWGTQNPRFFDGTVVAKAAAQVLNGNALRAAAQ